MTALLLLAQALDVEGIGATDFETREAAMERLIKAGDEALPLLRDAARSDDFEVAARARTILARRQTCLLKGFGLVVGLNGSGDSPTGETLESLKNILGNEFGRVVGDINSRNVALVAVTANLPAFQRPGTTIDVKVAAIGDATSIVGGTLFLTPLRSPRAKPEGPRVLGLAQGRIVVEGHDETTGVIKNGMIVEMTSP